MFVFLFRAFDGTIQTTPDSALNYNPVPQTPRLTESAIPISSVVGAFSPSEESATQCCYIMGRRFRCLASPSKLVSYALYLSLSQSLQPLSQLLWSSKCSQRMQGRRRRWRCRAWHLAKLPVNGRNYAPDLNYVYLQGVFRDSLESFKCLWAGLGVEKSVAGRFSRAHSVSN